MAITMMQKTTTIGHSLALRRRFRSLSVTTTALRVYKNKYSQRQQQNVVYNCQRKTPFFIGLKLHQQHLHFYHGNRLKQYYSIPKNQKEGILLPLSSSQEQGFTSFSTSLSKREIQRILSGNNNIINIDDKERTAVHERQDNQSIYKTLQAAIELMEKYQSPEPTISACHLLSFALKDDFKWEDNGFSILYSLLQNTDSSDGSANSTHLNNNRSESGAVALRDKLLTNEELDAFSSMVQRRMTNEPIQYIIGQWDFHDITIKVRPPCLCPRPETEELVEYVAKDIRNLLFIRKNYSKTSSSGSSSSSGRKVRVLDVGCGTGAISIALAKMFSPNDVQFVSIDVAREAIDLTKENANCILGDDDRNGEYFNTFLCSASDFTNEKENIEKENIKSYESEDKGSDQYEFGFDIVVSNPPYIPKRDMETLSEDVVGYEDYGALCGGDDGMDVIRDIVKRLPEWCYRESEGDGTYVGDAICWMEVDTSHPMLMSEWLTPTSDDQSYDMAGKHFGGVEYVEGLSDIFGLDRFVKLKIKNEK